MIPNSKEKILLKASELGQKFEQKFTGCAQSTIAAIFQAIGVWNDDVFKAGSGLADGLGLTGDGSCGAFIGASMVISYLFGREYKDFGDMYKPMESYRLVKKLHDSYLEDYGSCRCHDVQESLLGRTYNLWDPEDLKAAFQSGMMEHCSKLVGNISRLATEIILEAGFTPE